MHDGMHHTFARDTVTKISWITRAGVENISITAYSIFMARI